MKSRGSGGNCTPRPFDATHYGSCCYEKCTVGWPENGREDEAFRELVAIWHRLTRSVREAIMELVRRGKVWGCGLGDGIADCFGDTALAKLCRNS